MMTESKTTRWMPGRKAELVRAITSGATTIEQAMAQHSLSREELNTWLDRMANRQSLKATVKTRRVA